MKTDNLQLGILLSGGKDSLYAAYMASKEHQLKCAVTIKSTNKESYMFHTPNIDIVNLQAESMGLPLIEVQTKGEKEKELKDLHTAIKQAKEEYNIDGIITGAVASHYQASRVQHICNELDLWCFNPLWQIDQVQLLEDLLKNTFEVLIVGVFAYPFDKELLGKQINRAVIKTLQEAQEKYKINPAGEGGEIETLVIDCPLFEKKIDITKAKTNYDNYAGTYDVVNARLEEKKSRKQQKTDTPQQTQKNRKHQKGDILIISTINPSLPLFKHEFIRPLADIIEKTGTTYNTVQLEDVPEDIQATHIIITGTGLKDNAFLEHKKHVKQILKLNIPILGICAGAELLLPDNHKLEDIQEIGPRTVEELNEDTLTSTLGGKECYFLHSKGLRAIPFSSELVGLLASEKGIAAFKYKHKTAYGVQFHPEVNKKEFVKKFLKL